MRLLTKSNIHDKIVGIEEQLSQALNFGGGAIPQFVGRDVEVRAIADLPAKPSIATPLGQARLLHDLASIELQAAELGMRTLLEYPEAPHEFRMSLADIVRDEVRHLGLCLDGMKQLGFEWGHAPVHLILWGAVAPTDSLLDRILIVHRYLEGAGLDASVSILRKFGGIRSPAVTKVVECIQREEVGHVAFGSHWYHALLEKEGRSSEQDFSERLYKLRYRLPRRLEALSHELRLKAGFTTFELNELQLLQKSQIAGKKERSLQIDSQV